MVYRGNLDYFLDSVAITQIVLKVISILNTVIIQISVNIYITVSKYSLFIFKAVQQKAVTEILFNLNSLFIGSYFFISTFYYFSV